MSAGKQYKWEVKPGGSGAMDQATATAVKNANAASTSQSLRYNPANAHAPSVGADSASIAHAMSVPDSKHGHVEFQKGDGSSAVGADSATISHALHAPKPPRTINAIDKTQVGQPVAHPRPPVSRACPLAFFWFGHAKEATTGLPVSPLDVGEEYLLGGIFFFSFPLLRLHCCTAIQNWGRLVGAHMAAVCALLCSRSLASLACSKCDERTSKASSLPF
jgi:hypothetical protein